MKEVLLKVPTLNLKSAETYVGHLRTMSNDNDEPDIRKLMADYEGLANYIANKKSQRRKQPLALQTIRSYYVTLNSVALHYAGLVTPEAKAFYQQKQDYYNSAVLKKMGENEVNEKWDGDPPTWDELEELPDKFKGRQTGNGDDLEYSDKHLLVALYTLIPPRRSEYRTLVYLDKRPSKNNLFVRDRKHKDELRDNDGVPFNYVYPNDDGTYHMVIRNYKTDMNHGTYETDLPKDLSEILETYLENTNVQNNTVVFRVNVKRQKTGEPWRPLKSGSWSTKLSNALSEVFDRPINMDDLRHLYISSLPFDTLTTNQKEAIATQMGHTIKWQSYYRQFNVDDADGGPTDNAHAPANAEQQQIDLEIKMATLAMLKSQTDMFQAQTEYYRAKTRTLVTNAEST